MTDTEFRIFPTREAAQAWIDGETPEGTEPLVSTRECMRPVSWSGMKKADRSDMRMAVDSQHAADLNGAGEFGRTERFGYMEAGRAFGGAVSFRRRPGEKPAERIPRTAMGRQMIEQNGAAVEGGAHTDVAPAPTPPAAPPFEMDFKGGPLRPGLPAPTPGFETYEMRGNRLIVAKGDMPPVVILVESDKLVLKRL